MEPVGTEVAVAQVYHTKNIFGMISNKISLLYTNFTHIFLTPQSDSFNPIICRMWDDNDDDDEDGVDYYYDYYY